MAKKMHDILPPKLANKVENTIKDLERANKKTKAPVKVAKVKEPVYQPPVAPIEKPVAPKPRKKRRFPLRELFIGSGVIVLLLCVWAYLKLPKADIVISPKTSVLSLQEKITTDKTLITPDVAKKLIPARYVEQIKETSQQFPATGITSQDGKATGTITVYNKNDTAFTLIKGTHFLSDSGKFFVTLAKVTIPAGKKNAPGSISAQVQAESVGSDYNIGASKFSIPKLNGTAYYYSVYGESTTAMAGGYTGKVKKVTDDDLQSAKDVLSKQALAQAKTALKNSLADSDVLLDGAITSTVVEVGSDTKSGAIVDNFNEHAKVKVSGMVFKKQDLENLIKQDIMSQLSSGNKYLENSLEVTYSLGSVDAKSGNVVVNASASAKTYADIDTNDFTGLFSNKSGDQIKATVDRMYQGKVGELKVNFWPFWVNKAPSDKNRVNVQLHIQ